MKVKHKESTFARQDRNVLQPDFDIFPTSVVSCLVLIIPAPDHRKKAHRVSEKRPVKDFISIVNRIVEMVKVLERPPFAASRMR